MTVDGGWPEAPVVGTDRLTLEPLRVEHAEEMAPLLDDDRLHTFVGGRPPTVQELRARYARQVVGRSGDGTQGWCNWVMRVRATGAAVGTVQATLTRRSGQLHADIAWVTATHYQGRGYAREAATAMLSWLRRSGVQVVHAYIHPGHDASTAVARSLGLRPTDVVVDGETRWEG